MSARPSRLVLLGHPVSHSLSPRFQNAALRALDIPLRYEALDVPPESFRLTLTRLAEEGAAGNVTVPHKAAAARLCNRRTPLAARVGAVNTFWTYGDGSLVGDNTDVEGFQRAAAALLGDDTDDHDVAVLGAGGAAAAVVAAVEGWPRVRVTIHNRTRERAEALAARFPIVSRIADSAEDAARDATLVVNATSIGLSGDEHPVPARILRPDALVMDLVYRPGKTPWVRAALEWGHPAYDGLPMLIEQGALAFERWFGVPAPRDAMRAALEEE